MADAVQAARRFLCLADVDGFVLAAACGGGHRGPGYGALWLMSVGAPSTAKTETVNALAGVADQRVDTLTPASLLHWQKKPVQAGGVHRGRAAAQIGRFPHHR